jgi:hypothetical protein
MRGIILSDLIVSGLLLGLGVAASGCGGTGRADEANANSAATASCYSCGLIALPPPIVPTLHTLTVSADTLSNDLGLALGGTVFQISQDYTQPLSMLEGRTECHYDYSAERVCQQTCEADAAFDTSAELSSCLKGCQSQITLVCSPAPICGSYPEYSYVQLSSGLIALGGREACDPSSCQPCASDGTQASLYNRKISLPYPLLTTTVGLITYHCTATTLRFTIPAALPTTVDYDGIHFTVAGTDESPAVTCDNGAPDLDIGNPAITVNVVPSLDANGKIQTELYADFNGSVSAHNWIGGIINFIDDAQDRLTFEAGQAITNQLYPMQGSFAGGLDQLVRNLAQPKIDHIDHLDFGPSGLVVYYYPVQ